METVVSGYVGSTVLANGTTATTQSAADNSTKVATTAYADAAAAAATSGMTRLAQVVTTGSTSTITFSSIAGTYTTLKIIIYGRDTDTTAGVLGIRIRANGDTTSGNYTSSQYILGTGAAASSNTIAATSAGVAVASLPGTNNNANALGWAEITIPGYANTTFWKTFSGRSDEVTAAANTPEIVNYTAWWKSASAITSLVLTAGSTAFVNGTTATLYGLA